MIGAPLPRREDARFLAGRGRYVADLVRPGMLHAAFLRSPHAHAGLVRVDVAAARGAPGVVACLTGTDLAPEARPIRAPSRLRGYRPTDWPALAVDKVRHVGEAVAVVVAESRYAAEDAAERIAVQWALRPVPGDAESAMMPGTPLVHEAAGSNVLVSRTFTQGDAESALSSAPIVVGGRFRFHRHAGVAMENRACLAEFDAGGGGLTVWSTTQVPGVVRDTLAELLRLPVRDVRVVAPDVGGGFGVKGAVYPEEVVVAAAARRLGRPVKWVGDRREDLLTTTQAWDEVVEAELGVDGEGTILALRARIVADVGAYSVHPWTASIEVLQVAGFLPGPYRVPAYHAEAHGVATCKTPMGPYRGVGRPVSVFVTERLLDRAARRLSLDPVEVRRRNLIRSEEMPYRSPSGIVWNHGRFVECLDGACHAAGYAALREEQRRLRGEGRWRGIGVASYVELTGLGSAIPASPGADVSSGTEGATVRVDAGGGVTAVFALASQGQGHETALAQVVAGELGVRVEDVRVMLGDTAVGPHGTGTYASRAAVLGGGAAILAARAVRDKALAIAAHLLEASPADLDLDGAVASVHGAPGRTVSLAEVARAAYAGTRRLPPGMEPGLESTRFYDPYVGAASGATHIAVVDVDVEACAVRVVRHVVVEDCGRIINPLIVEGQVRGGVVQGLGAALLEEVVHDHAGQLLTGSLLDYLVPGATEVPPIEVGHVEIPAPTTLGGFKGMGEGGTIGAPGAIASAIADALAPLGVEVSELPLTPERLYRLLEGASGR